MIFLLDTSALIYLQSGKLMHGLPTGSYAYSVISEVIAASYAEAHNLPGCDNSVSTQNRNACFTRDL